MLVPSAASPDLTAYASFEVQNNGVVCPSPAPTGSQCPASKLVTMYTNYSAPGAFSMGANGFGPAAAESATFKPIGPNNPAKPGDIPALFATGMGSVTPPLADGIPSSPTGRPPNVIDYYNGSEVSVYFDGHASPNIQFAGVVPGFPAGMYQINAQIPSNVSTGNDYVDLLTPDGEAEQVTLHIEGASSAGTAAAIEKTMRMPSGRGRADRRGSAIPQRVMPLSR